MAAVSKNVYFDALDGVVDKYNNTYQNIVKIKSTDVKSNYYTEYNVDSNDKDPKFKIGDHIRISKYKNSFAEEWAPNWSEEVFLISKIKNTVPWTYFVNDLNGKGFVGTFHEKELQKTKTEEFRTKRVIKIKRNKLSVKWKGYNNSFSS